MADPHVVLAPIVEPPLPPVSVVAAATTPWLLLSVMLGATLVLGWWLWWWRQAAPARALRRIARMPDAVQAAHQLAQWQRRHGRSVTPQWQLDLDRLRFAAPDAQAAQTLQRLCADAAEVVRAGKAG